MNVFLGRERVRGPLRRLDRGAMAAAATALLDELDAGRTACGRRSTTLSGGQRQGVAIARAMLWAQRLVLMDEPTAALGVTETRRVEELIVRLRDRGKAILLVSRSLRPGAAASPTGSASCGAAGRSACSHATRRAATRSSR